MVGNQASGFKCPGCGNAEAFIYDYSNPPDPLAIALTCKRCEASWWEILVDG